MFPFSLFKKKKIYYSSTYNFSPEIREFVDALKECHLQNRPLYFAKLKKLAATYPEEPLFFLFAGDLVRESNPKKALEIHRELLFRTVTTGLLRSMVLEHVAQDYLVMGENKKALLVLKDAEKCSNLPTIMLALAKVYEKESKYEEAWTELENYISKTNLKNSTLLQTLAANAVNYFLFSAEKSEEKAVYWLEILAKKLINPVQSSVANYQILLLKDKSKKAILLLQELTKAGENWEILARSLLLKNKNGKEINYAVEGKYKSLFHALLNPNLKFTDAVEPIGKETLVIKKLMFANADVELAQHLEEVIPTRSLFYCKKCGKHLHRLTPVCDSCHAITERKFVII